MAVVCPYCRHRMRVKAARAGRFRPICDRCRRRFLLVLSDDPDVAPMVLSLQKNTPDEPPRRPPRP